MAKVLIVGYGNPLRGDDGVGWRAAERLRGAIRDPDVEIHALHQLTPEVMEALGRADRAIFIDACVGAVAGARALYGHAPQATLITVTGGDFSLSEELSPSVSAAMDGVVRVALRLI